MKKIILALTIVMTFGFVAKAQTDYFITPSEYSGSIREDITWVIPILPTGGIGSSNEDQSALPLGNGILVLTALGAGYAVSRKRKK